MNIDNLLLQINRRFNKIEHEIEKLKKKQNKRKTIKVTKSVPVKMDTTKSTSEKVNATKPTPEKVNNDNPSPKKTTKKPTNLEEMLKNFPDAENTNDEPQFLREGRTTHPQS